MSVMSNSVWPHRWKPIRLLCPWDSPGKNTGVGCHYLLQCMKVKSESEVTQLHPTLRDPMDCSLPGSSIHGIFQRRVLEWGAIACSESRIDGLFCILQWNAVLECNLKNGRMISLHLQGKLFNIMVIQAYAPTSNTEEAEVELFYEDLQDTLELTPKKRCPFHYRGLECKSRK